MCALNVVKSNMPGQQAITKLQENTEINNGRASRGMFNKIELDDLYSHLSNIRQYTRETALGHTLSTYTNWSHVEASDGYSVWKYPLSGLVTSTNNEVYNDDVKLDRAGVASSESTVSSFASVQDSDAKHTGPTYTNNTSEASSASGTPFNLTSFATVTNEVVSAVHSGTSIQMDYQNIVDGSVAVVKTTLSATYTEDTDYTIDYASGTIITLSAGSITSGMQLYVSYIAGNIIYLGASGTFNSINLDLATKGVGNALAFDYSSGSSNWVNFTPTLDATNGFATDGNISWTIASLTNWTTDTVNSSAGLYWIRIRNVQQGMIFPTGYQMVKADSAATKLVSMTQKEIEDSNWKWSYFSGNLYMSIPNDGPSGNEGVTYVKSSSNSTKKQNYFVYNNSYFINYYNTTSGDLLIHNNLRVSGNTWLSGNLTVGGTLNISGGITISGDLTVSGNFNVDGNTVLSGTLLVSGLATLNSGVEINGILNVSDTASLSGTLVVTGTSDLNSTLDVNGLTSLSGGLNVYGNTNLSGTLHVSGAVTLASTLGVTGSITTSDILGEQIDSNATGFNRFQLGSDRNSALDNLGSFYFTGDVGGTPLDYVRLNGDIRDATGGSELSRFSIYTMTAGSLDANFYIQGADVTCNGTLNVSGAVTIASTLTTTSTITASGNITTNADSTGIAHVDATNQGVHSVGSIGASTISVADNETFTFELNTAGLFYVVNETAAEAGCFFAQYTTNTVVALSDISSKFEVTDTDTGKIAVFKGTNDSTISVKNYTNGTISMRVVILGYSESATAPA